ncbi:unnamed protein product [Phytophthora fragariaefolia]|uniref:Unnamed protein product n=1 Tax=Phytophthora fragariaefolia TaxID=1490495 RepID=A0A9W6U293_9STRA|nr:unnamed protein product [Phytophthora fragariaefolia]
MSLFSAMADEGSVWAQGSSLFNISSPLNDLLEKDDFTLEQVLQEDELVQEVKTRNTKLIDLYAPPPSLFFPPLFPIPSVSSEHFATSAKRASKRATKRGPSNF